MIFSEYRNHIYLIWIILVSIISFCLHGYDKHVSQKENSRRLNERIPEKWLHICSAIGGTPGSLAGMHIFRHKTVKEKYQNVFWTIVVAQIVILIFIGMNQLIK